MWWKQRADSDFKQLGTKCGGHGKRCTEVSRHRRLCDLPWVTGGGIAKCGSVSSVVCLRDFVLGVLATVIHGVGARASGDEGTTVEGTFVGAGSFESQAADVRGP
jgi:hypothetical protein